MRGFRGNTLAGGLHVLLTMTKHTAHTQKQQLLPEPPDRFVDMARRLQLCAAAIHDERPNRVELHNCVGNCLAVAGELVGQDEDLAVSK